MADNTTLYIIIGIVLLLAVMNANAQPSVTGGPAMSAYLRAGPRKVTRKAKVVINWVRFYQT